MIGARASFCAAHRLPQHKELHGHSYEVWAYTRTWDDVEQWQSALKQVCEKFDHRTLGPDLSKMEQLAQFIGEHLVAERVLIVRPVEGLSAEWLSE